MTELLLTMVIDDYYLNYFENERDVTVNGYTE